MTGIEFGKKRIFKKTGGYTLIELLVSLSVFSLVMFGGAQIYQSIIVAQRNLVASQLIQDNLRYAKEMITKELRNAKMSSADCTALIAYATAAPTHHDAGNIYSALNASNQIINGGHGNSPDKDSLGDKLVFKNKFGECVKYSVQNGSLMVSRSNGTATSTLPITAPSIKVDGIKFYVHDNDVDIFPSVTFMIKAEVPGRKKNFLEPLLIQSTVTARDYEKFIY